MDKDQRIAGLEVALAEMTRERNRAIYRGDAWKEARYRNRTGLDLEDLHQLYERLEAAERFEKRMVHAEMEWERFQRAARVAAGFIRAGRPGDAQAVLDGELRSRGTDLTGILSALDEMTPEELAELGFTEDELRWPPEGGS